ncbi:MAG: MMPL family transporter [Rhodothermales bacterium]|nr:MMPL family transporter [Rhodothermales bacterium]
MADLPYDLDKYLNETDDGYVVVSYLYPKRFPWAAGALDPLDDTLRLLRFDELEGTAVIGGAVRKRSHAQTLTQDLFRALIVVVVLVTMILWFQFRSLTKIVLCFLPVLCGICGIVVVMALLNIELNMLTLSIAPLLVGIGIDDGIHIVERLHQGQRRDEVFREAGSCMTATTLTTVAAFSCMVLADFDGVQEMGLLGVVGLVVSLLAAVHLLPWALSRVSLPAFNEERSNL